MDDGTDDTLLDSPGAVASGATDPGDIENLPISFSPTLTNLLPVSSTPILLNLPSPTMDDSEFTGLGGSSSSDDLLTPAESSSLLNFGEGIGTSLTNALVVNPANAQTEEGLIAAGATTSTASTSAIFTLFFYGLIAFLIISIFDKK